MIILSWNFNELKKLLDVKNFTKIRILIHIFNTLLELCCVIIIIKFEIFFNWTVNVKIFDINFSDIKNFTKAQKNLEKNSVFNHCKYTDLIFFFSKNMIAIVENNIIIYVRNHSQSNVKTRVEPVITRLAVPRSNH